VSVDADVADLVGALHVLVSQRESFSKRSGLAFLKGKRKRGDNQSQSIDSETCKNADEDQKMRDKADDANRGESKHSSLGAYWRATFQPPRHGCHEAEPPKSSVEEAISTLFSKDIEYV
jgi:hypothetical protein